MTLDEIRANQHMDVKTPSDFQLEDYLLETDSNEAALDLVPTTPAEIRHFLHAKELA